MIIGNIDTQNKTYRFFADEVKYVITQLLFNDGTIFLYKLGDRVLNDLWNNMLNSSVNTLEVANHSPNDVTFNYTRKHKYLVIASGTNLHLLTHYNADNEIYISHALVCHILLPK